MGGFNNLPDDIILDIITRLSTESILHCKLVCKPWRYLVSDHPSFYRMYLTHLNTDSDKLSFLVTDETQHLHYFEYNIDDTPSAHSTRKINYAPPLRYSYNVLGSRNGLVCLYELLSQAYCICNPVTRECLTLPKFNTYYDDQYIRRSSGFGYLPSTSEYKIVELCMLRRAGANFIEVGVYTLGSGHGWRNIGRFSSKFSTIFTDCGVFVNGALHWRNGLGGVVAFDLTEEKFREHLSPPPLTVGCFYYSLGELGGVLYYGIYYIKPKGLEIWLLKEKNDNVDMEEQVQHETLGWRNELSLPGGEPLAFTKSGRVLCFNGSSVSTYDAVTLTSIKLLDIGKFNRAIPHKNTLVSLKELGEEDTKIMVSAEFEETSSRDLMAKLLAR